MQGATPRRLAVELRDPRQPQLQLRPTVVRVQVGLAPGPHPKVEHVLDEGEMPVAHGLAQFSHPLPVEQDLDGSLAGVLAARDVANSELDVHRLQRKWAKFVIGGLLVAWALASGGAVDPGSLLDWAR